MVEEDGRQRGDYSKNKKRSARTDIKPGCYGILLRGT